jgi:hypothetical protein
MNTATSNTTNVPTTPAPLVRTYKMSSLYYQVPPPAAPRVSRYQRATSLDGLTTPRILFPEISAPGAPRRPRRTHSQPLHNAENVRRRLDFSDDEVPTEIDNE